MGRLGRLRPRRLQFDFGIFDPLIFQNSRNNFLRPKLKFLVSQLSPPTEDYNLFPCALKKSVGTVKLPS
jgi:hypothetical protein